MHAQLSDACARACTATAPKRARPPARRPPRVQEARALRYLHAAAPGGAAPGVVRLLDSFMLGAHYCLVTGAALAAC